MAQALPSSRVKTVGDLEFMLPVAEALVQGLQLGVRVHASCSNLLLLHLPDECQIIVKQAPLAIELLLRQHAATLRICVHSADDEQTISGTQLYK